MALRNSNSPGLPLRPGYSLMNITLSPKQLIVIMIFITMLMSVLMTDYVSAAPQTPFSSVIDPRNAILQADEEPTPTGIDLINLSSISNRDDVLELTFQSTSKIDTLSVKFSFTPHLPCYGTTSAHVEGIESNTLTIDPDNEPESNDPILYTITSSQTLHEILQTRTLCGITSVTVTIEGYFESDDESNQVTRVLGTKKFESVNNQTFLIPPVGLTSSPNWGLFSDIGLSQSTAAAPQSTIMLHIPTPGDDTTKTWSIEQSIQVPLVWSGLPHPTIRKYLLRIGTCSSVIEYSLVVAPDSNASDGIISLYTFTSFVNISDIVQECYSGDYTQWSTSNDVKLKFYPENVQDDAYTPFTSDLINIDNILDIQMNPVDSLPLLQSVLPQIKSSSTSEGEEEGEAGDNEEQHPLQDQSEELPVIPLEFLDITYSILGSVDAVTADTQITCNSAIYILNSDKTFNSDNEPLIFTFTISPDEGQGEDEGQGDNTHTLKYTYTLPIADIQSSLIEVDGSSITITTVLGSCSYQPGEGSDLNSFIQYFPLIDDESLPIVVVQRNDDGGEDGEEGYIESCTITFPNTGLFNISTSNSITVEYKISNDQDIALDIIFYASGYYYIDNSNDDDVLVPFTLYIETRHVPSGDSSAEMTFSTIPTTILDKIRTELIDVDNNDKYIYLSQLSFKIGAVANDTPGTTQSNAIKYADDSVVTDYKITNNIIVYLCEDIHPGYYGYKCSVPDTCDTHDLLDQCSLRGSYNHSNPNDTGSECVCQCNMGYGGDECEIDLCEGEREQDTPVCGPDQLKKLYFDTDTNKCYLECECEYGSTCPSNQYSLPPTADSRECPTSVNEVYQHTCVCFPDFYGPDCIEKGDCYQAQVDDFNNCNGRGYIYPQDGDVGCATACTCIAGYSGTKCENVDDDDGDDDSDNVNICDPECDRSSTRCDIFSQCTCLEAPLYGWSLDEHTMSSCSRPCPCEHFSGCLWDNDYNGSLECECNPDFRGNSLCSKATTPPNPQCTDVTFEPALCVHGTVECDPVTNEPICSCSSNTWHTPESLLDSPIRSGKHCNTCYLIHPDTPQDQQCSIDGTHRISFTAPRCSSGLCTCKADYTGKQCNNNALYSTITFKPQVWLHDTLDIVKTKFVDSILQSIISSIQRSYEVSSDRIMNNISLYTLNTKTIPAKENETNEEQPGQIGDYYCENKSKPSTSLDNATSGDNEYVCIDEILLTFILNREEMEIIINTGNGDGDDDGKGDGNGSDFKIQNHRLDRHSTLQVTPMNDLASLWDNAIADLPTDVTTDMGTGSTTGLYDPLYCNSLKQQGTTPLPQECLISIDYEDQKYDSIADNYDSIFDGILPTQPSTSDDKKSNAGIIVGIVFGVVGVFVIVMIIICCMKSKKLACFNEEYTDGSGQSQRRSRTSKRSHKSSEMSIATGRDTGTHTPGESANAPSSGASSSNQASNQARRQTALPQNADSSSGLRKNSGDKRPLPEGWTRLLDPNSGKEYYYHEKTLTSSWKHPDDRKNGDDSLW